MARRGDGLYQRGNTWYLDCRIDGMRYVIKLGRKITRTVAGEIANMKRAAILRGEAGIGKKRKDMPFDKAKEAFLEWAKTNKRPRTVRVYTQQLDQLAKSFSGKTLRQISAFDIERHKRNRTENGARVVANREVSVLKNLINKAKAWGMFEGDNPACAVKLLKEPKRRLRFLDATEEAKFADASPPWLGHLITIGCNTGLRIGAEFLPLQWPSVDLRRDTVIVEAAYSKNGESRTCRSTVGQRPPFKPSMTCAEVPSSSQNPMGNRTRTSMLHLRRHARRLGWMVQASRSTRFATRSPRISSWRASISSPCSNMAAGRTCHSSNAMRT